MANYGLFYNIAWQFRQVMTNYGLFYNIAMAI